MGQILAAQNGRRNDQPVQKNFNVLRKIAKNGNHKTSILGLLKMKLEISNAHMRRTQYLRFEALH
jgi:hypothetical protein